MSKHVSSLSEVKRLLERTNRPFWPGGNRTLGIALIVSVTMSGALGAWRYFDQKAADDQAVSERFTEVMAASDSLVIAECASQGWEVIGRFYDPALGSTKDVWDSGDERTRHAEAIAARWSADQERLGVDVAGDLADRRVVELCTAWKSGELSIRWEPES